MNNPAQVPTLRRSKNYLDLNDETHDNRNNKLDLSVSNDEDDDEEIGEPQEDLAPSMPETYANIDAETVDHGTVGPDGGQENEVARINEMATEGRLDILRDLLQIERRKNDQRRNNNRIMQEYVKQLQSDYLKLQRDLLETLELGHKIKAQKEAQIESLNETVKEKDRHIEQLKEKLDSLDEDRLQQEFKELMAKQNKLAQVERQQLKDQIETVEQQLVRERVNNSQLLQQFQTKLDDQLKSNKAEVDRWCSKATNLELELERLLNEPSNLMIKSLREEKTKLECQVGELNVSIDDYRIKFDSLRKRLENLLGDQDLIETKNREELEQWQQKYAELRKVYNEAKLGLEDKEEVVQIVQFNLRRSEKRVKSLLNTLRGKDAAYKELIEQLQEKQEQVSEKSSNSLRALERKVVEFESEVDRKQNEIVRLQLEHENRLESIKNDRDQRLMSLEQEKQKTERSIQALEIQLANIIEDRDSKMKQVEQLQKEVLQFREEAKRLSIELATSEARLFSRQQELDQLVKEYSFVKEENEVRQVSELDLDEMKRHTQRLEETIDELRNDNEKLSVKLKLNESHIASLDASIKKEHAKMVLDYEKKMEQIKMERSIYDRNKIRYKKYGYKLKKYCDHLRRVHEHLCSPTICGYTITN